MARTAPRIKRKPKTGDYRNGKKERWNGFRWVPVNIVHKGQKATLNGKPVTADGRGNWVSKGNSRGSRKKTVGRYAPGERVKTTPLPTIPAKDRPKDMQSGRVYGDAGQPPAPKLPPKPKATTPKTPEATTPKTPEAPKPKGTQTQQELQGTSEFIKKFSGKKGMERAVEQAKKRRDRLKKQLNMQIRSDAQKTQNRSAA